MIVQPDMLQLIRARRKTRLTIPAAQPCRLTPGRVYQARTVNADWTAQELRDWAAYCQAEQPSRGRAVVAYLAPPIDAALADPAPVKVTVVSVWQTTLGHVTQQDAQREGHRFLQQFRNRWESLYGPWEAERPVWVVSFYVGDLREMFDYPRLLKARPGHSGEQVEEHQDYTDRPHLAMFAEPEAVDARTLDQYAKAAREHDRLRKAATAARRDARPLHESVRELEQAQANGENGISRQLQAIRRLAKAS